MSGAFAQHFSTPVRLRALWGALSHHEPLSQVSAPPTAAAAPTEHPLVHLANVQVSQVRPHLLLPIGLLLAQPSPARREVISNAVEAAGAQDHSHGLQAVHVRGVQQRLLPQAQSEEPYATAHRSNRLPARFPTRLLAI